MYTTNWIENFVLEYSFNSSDDTNSFSDLGKVSAFTIALL